ncbi:MAG: SDR family NAD(P)-dependent oxidoreductase [Actinophytocola sp.]|uniref:type I polyketide synthase n=1 Tax=Actinophytocola sp. TaxID=1872138 RepID=UPI003C787131
MTTSEKVAIVGLACRFPGAMDAAGYWANLRAGVESLAELDRDALRAAGVPAAVLDDPDYVPVLGEMAGADEFDAGFFGINPREAGIMDPQHRLLLECAWTALEDAGWVPERAGGSVGVFVGGYRNDHPDLVPARTNAEVFARNIANEADYLATRLAYKLDLHGPSVTVQTACSTSLVALHLAARAVLSGECDLALAGGVTVRAGQVPGYVYQRGGILSPDGHCRAFDADADGSVLGEGMGVVVVKRLSSAIADGDDIRAVVLGSAIGNDGGDRVGFTAPGVHGQARLIGAALARSGAHPDTIGYVEAHGSGTPLGDRIEIDALTRAYRAAGWTAGQRPIGSVKTNIGHTHTAAGVAGLIKAVLALRHREIPPGLHFRTPNPRIDFAASPFLVAVERAGWPAADHPRRASVSSFGLGGAGAHVILEEAPERVAPASTVPHHALPLSARTAEALETATGRLGAWLAERPGLDLGSVAATLQRGRRPLRHRGVVIAADTAQAAAALTERDPARLFGAERAAERESVVFLCPGLGDQYPQMGRGLYESEPCFRERFDECADLLAGHVDLRAALYPGEPPRRTGPDLRSLFGRGAAATGLTATAVAHPALFAVEYAMARVWLARGVRPHAIIGYSLGEYVAACLAGVLTLPDALELVARRATLIDALPEGAMAAVPLPAAQVEALLTDDLALAAVNGPSLCVVAGPPGAVEALRARLASDGVATRALNTTHAFHSPMMAQAANAMTEVAKGFARSAPTIPFLSNVTGDWITDADATDPGYWARHLCSPVRFTDGARALWSTPGQVYLEVGPGRALGGLMLSTRPADDDTALTLDSLPSSFDGRADTAVVAETTGKLWLAGVPVDWPATHGRDEPVTVALPTYPFEPVRHGGTGFAMPAAPTTRATGRRGLDDWFHVPVWEPAEVPASAAEPQRWLVFADACGVGTRLAERLRAKGNVVTVATEGTGWRGDDDRVTVSPDEDEHYRRLLAEVAPTRIAHCWTVTDRAGEQPRDAIGFHSLVRLAKAVGAGGEPIEVSVVTSDLHPLGDTLVSRPDKATVLGPCRVWPKENPSVRCRAIDLGDPTVTGWRAARLDDALLAEVSAPITDEVVALRGGQRWRQEFAPARLPSAEGLRTGGVYLITGGLGDVGLALAEHLAATVDASLVLVGRSRPDGDRAERVLALGARVVTHIADVTDADRMREIVRDTVGRFGALNGVVHAAGVAGGGVIQLKDLAEADRVLAPKVAGARAILAACDGVDVDFVALFSSLIAVTGGAGQVDYCAANAHLDALAQHVDAVGGPRTISVNWDAWREIGMAARTAGRPAPAHPLLDERVADTDAGGVYGSTFTAEDTWLVDEHRMLGHPVVPGTGHLELARAAFADRTGHELVELREVTFATPIVLDQTGQKDVRVVLEKAGDGWSFSVASRLGDGWQWNSTGLVGPAEPTGRTHDLPALINRMTETVGLTNAGPMGFAGRSLCLRRMWACDGEYLAELELPAEFCDDLAAFALHPSLMDIGAAYVGLSVGTKLRIPISYGRLTMSGRLPRRVFSHHRYTEPDTADRETVTGDFTLLAEDGTELVAVTGFVLKHAADLPARLTGARDGTADDVAPYRLPTFSQPRAGSDFVQRQLATGMSTAEGVEALLRILGGARSAQVVVSTRDLAEVTEEITAPVEPARGDAHPRPNLLTAYAEPRDDTERTLAGIWQELLGVDRIGVHDHFFELGGHSLLGIQLSARLRADLGIELPLGALFDALTVARLAETVAEARTAR